MVDLHMHSTASDGTDSPKRIIEKCSKLRLALASITDHDTVKGQAEAVRAARKAGLPYVTGAEFSVKYEGELHILGYGLDISNASLLDEMRRLQKSRTDRMMAIVDNLNAEGKKISYGDVLKHAGGQSVGRPHIAQALLEKGYVGSFDEAFTLYIGDRGSCYVPREKLSPEEAIALITGAGGYPVIAHPKFIRTDDLEGLVNEFSSYRNNGKGLWGIEAYYPAHSDRETERFADISERHGLHVTSGSDYHGSIKKVAIASERREGKLLSESIECLLKKAI